MTKRIKLLELYKSHYNFAIVVDSLGNDIVDSENAPIVLQGEGLSFEYGIFNAINNLLDDEDPLKEIFSKAEEMTTEYYLNWSGQKWIAPMYVELLDINHDNLDLVDITLARSILNRYKDNWTKRMLALSLVYNPIHNYDMDETRRDNIDLTEKNDGSYDVYGYNSGNASPSDKSNTTVTTTGTADKNYRTTKRSGNIGVTTSQKLLNEELEVRTYEMIKSIYRDIDKVLVLSVY